MAFESQMMGDARIDVGALFAAVRKRLPRVALVTAGLLAATFVILMFVPRLYESSASILVEPRSNIYLRSTSEQGAMYSGNDASVVSSQIGLVKSRDTLLTVIDKLNLRSEPEFNGSGGEGFSPFGILGQLLGRKSAPISIDEVVLNALYDRLSVSQERDSRIISVEVSSTNPELAAEIANAVANAHVARRTELSLSDTAEASGWLADEIAKLRVSVTAAETAVANFKVENDLFIGSNNTSLSDQELSTIATQITAAQERKNAAQSRAALIRSMVAKGQPIDGIAGVRDSAIIQQLSQEKARLQGEKAQRSATLLANHPTIQALTAQIAELNNQINLEGRRVADALDVEAQVEADLEASLQADLARAKSSASTATRDTVTLDSLEREAKAQRDLLEGYLQRYSEALSRTESNSALPDVRVISVAAPSVTPASPKVPVILISVGFAALMVQLGVIVFGELMSGRALVRYEPMRPQDELDEPPLMAAELEAEENRDAPAAPEAEVHAFAPSVAPEPAREARRTGELAQLVKSLARPPEARTEPEPEAEEADAPVLAAPGDVVALTTLASDLVQGHTRLLLLAAHRSNADCAALAEELVSDVLGRGLSVALIDAGSGMMSEELGLTDLSADMASFGDVVHKSADNNFAEVVWGQGRSIVPTSNKPFTLVEALGDIYEVVVVMTGRIGRASSLPVFEGLKGRLMLVAGADDDLRQVSATREKLLDAGFEQCEVAVAPARVAA